MKKKQGRPSIPADQRKKNETIRLYKHQRKYLEKKFGGLQSGVDILIEKDKARTSAK